MSVILMRRALASQPHHCVQCKRSEIVSCGALINCNEHISRDSTVLFSFKELLYITKSLYVGKRLAYCTYLSRCQSDNSAYQSGVWTHTLYYPS